MSKYIKQDHNPGKDVLYINAIQYKKLLQVWSYIMDNPDILVDAGYDVDTLPNLFRECRDVLFSSNSSRLLKYQMKELNKIWRILNK
tara:strand:+ start:3371 stop:3631 length:261 start_codon:yes stop_codon:yes gene_type:complete